MAARYSHTHAYTAQYASPIIREPSPASTVGSTHANQTEDLTSVSDSEEVLSQEDFERKWADKIGLYRVREDEEKANEDPLIRKESEDETLSAYLERLQKLRQIVKQEEENYMFEQTLLRGSQVGLEPLPTSDDVDTIIGAMMSTSTLSQSGLQRQFLRESMENMDPEGAAIIAKKEQESILDGPWSNVGGGGVHSGGMPQPQMFTLHTERSRQRGKASTSTILGGMEVGMLTTGSHVASFGLGHRY